MNYLSRLLELMTRALFWRRAPGRRSRAAAPPVVPRVVCDQPSPDMWGARIVAGRVRRRDGYAPPAPWWEDTGVIVRPYVAHLGSAPRTARTGTQADPWGPR
jgi:hypothetical protein